MKLLILLIALGFVSGCATKAVITPETETYFSVEPASNTKIITYHVQAEKLSPALQAELKQALANFQGKCWIWSLPSSKQALVASGPESCVKFVAFTTVKPLKPYKKEPTDKKMLLTALAEEGHIQVQNFVWDGAKMQRVRNADSSLNERSFQDFMMLWALK